jgi:hypothetical protein
MKRHLKVRAELLRLRNEVVKVTILEKVAEPSKFSKLGMSHPSHHSGVFRHGDVLLIASKYLPNTSYTGFKYNNGFQTNMHYFEIGPTPTLTLPTEVWPKIKKAIEAYNEWGAENPIEG